RYLSPNITNLVYGFMRLGHAIADFDQEIKLLFQILLRDLEPGIAHDLQRSGVLPAVYGEPDLVSPGQSFRTISVAGPKRRTGHPRGAFVMHIPDKAVQSCLCRQALLRWTAKAFFFSTASFSGLWLRREFADYLAFLIEDFESDRRGLRA